MRKPFNCLIIATILLVGQTAVAARKDFRELSVHGLSLAPNAGGQEAYRIEGYERPHAWHAFYNKALLVDGMSLLGAGYNFRMSACDENCFWRFFAQVGGGLSNGGPYGEISWGAIIPLIPLWLPTSAPKYIPSLRLDITSQFYLSRSRIITWSYPIWAGVSLAF
jgi:hypothetical protein